MRKCLYSIMLFVFFAISKANAFTLEHEFDVFVGNFNASRTKFVYSLSENTYEIASDVKTYGAFDTLYPFRARYSTSGNIDKGVFKTKSYKYNAKSRFNKRTKELVYDSDGKPLYNMTSKNDKSKKRAVNENIETEGTTDLQTVFAELVRQYNDKRTCDIRMEVFDGKRRFDVIFKDAGVEEVKANKYSEFEGVARKCEMYIDSLGNKGEDMLWELSSDRPVIFWIMEYGEKKRPFVARAEIAKTGYGRLLVYTRKVRLFE